MQNTMTEKSEIKLVGITARTNNANEADPSTAKITTTVQKYFHTDLPSKITNRKTPNTTYCVYTDYESDLNGDYTYFIGEEVTSFERIPETLETLTIPAQKYVKITNGPDKMPEICIQTWHSIWEMTEAELGGERAYIADFEVYDERAQDHSNVILDIYIGIKDESE